MCWPMIGPVPVSRQRANQAEMAGNREPDTALQAFLSRDRRAREVEVAGQVVDPDAGSGRPDSTRETDTFLEPQVPGNRLEFGQGGAGPPPGCDVLEKG